MHPIDPASSAPQSGPRVYGAAAVILGLIGLAWGDFAGPWQNVAANVPHRAVLAFLAAAGEFLGGAALLWPRTARAGALLLTAVFAAFTALWVPAILKAPGVYDGWGNFFEELSLTIGGAVAFLSLSQGEEAPRRAATVARLYAICVVSFGIVHFNALRPAASWVPAWLPPSQVFWVAATGVCFFLAAIAIFTGVLARLASRLLVLMIIGFGFLIWLPRLRAAPHDHFTWGGNGINLAMAGAAWVVAGAISRQRASASSSSSKS